MRVRVSKLEMQVKSLTSRLAELTAREEELRNAEDCSEEDKAQLAALARAVAKLKKRHEAAKVHTDRVEAEIAKLQQHIMGVGGKRLRKQKQRVSRARPLFSAPPPPRPPCCVGPCAH